MKNEKITNRSAIEYVITNYELPMDVHERLEKMLESLSKKSSNKTTKPTAVQIENENRKAIIIQILTETSEGLTSSEITKLCDEKIVEDEKKIGSNQRATALLKQLIAEDKVRKEKKGGKSLFYII